MKGDIYILPAEHSRFRSLVREMRARGERPAVAVYERADWWRMDTYERAPAWFALTRDGLPTLTGHVIAATLLGEHQARSLSEPSQQDRDETPIPFWRPATPVGIPAWCLCGWWGYYRYSADPAPWAGTGVHVPGLAGVEQAQHWTALARTGEALGVWRYAVEGQPFEPKEGA